MNKTLLLKSLIAMVIVLSCNTTKITSSWREPDKTISLNSLSKVLVVALFNDETSRRKAEDEMVAYLNGSGIQSYKYLDADFNKKNEEGIRMKIKDAGFDGAITMRLIDVEKEKTFNHSNISSFPNYHWAFSGFYARNWAFHSDNGYYTSTKIYTIETHVFSIKEDKIIWTGLTKTTDPDGVRKMTAEVANVVYKKMINEGFVSKK